MGNELSAPTEEGPHVEHQQRLFNEYKMMTMADLERARLDNERWDSVKDTILDLPIEEQAKYCDYVTAGICSMSEEIINSSAASLLKQMNWILENKRRMGVCAVANTAKVIISVQDDQLAIDLKSLFALVLTLQRELKETPNLREEIDAMDMNDPDNASQQMGRLMAGMMRDITRRMDDGQDPADMGRDLLTQLGGRQLADEITAKIQIAQFMQERLNQGMKLGEVIRLTRDQYDIPPGLAVEVKIKVNFDELDQDDGDDEQSSGSE